jgi:hypothetical protein
MKILLSAPFRIDIELTPHASVNRDAPLVAALGAALRSLRLADSPFVVEEARSHERPGMLYGSLGEDATPATVLPLVRLTHRQPDSVVPPAADLRGTVLAVNCQLHDRSLAVLDIEVEVVDPADGPALAWLGQLDAWSNRLAAQLIDEATPTLRATCAALQRARLPDGQAVVRAIGSTSACFDMASGRNAAAPYPLLWVSRVLCVPAALARSPAITAWTHGQYEALEPIAVGQQRAHLGVGNSVLIGDEDGTTASAVLQGLQMANGLYAIVHVLTHNQRTLIHRLVESEIQSDWRSGWRNLWRAGPRPQDGAALAAAATVSIRKALDVFEQDHEDTLVGLQGMRRTVVSTYLARWRFDLLIKTCRKRIASAQAMVDDANAQRNRRYARVVESTLVVIGSVTVLDFTLNLLTFVYAVAELDDGYYGLIDLARGAPPDLILNVLLVMLVLLALERFRR